MNTTTSATLACINCQRDEGEIPLTQWQMAGQRFWLCPDCLPFLIHRRAEVMPRWNLSATTTATGGEHAEG
jgi:hypothetical protein